MEVLFLPELGSEGPDGFLARCITVEKGVLEGFLCIFTCQAEFLDLVPWDMTPVGAIAMGVMQGFPEKDLYIV